MSFPRKFFMKRQGPHFPVADTRKELLMLTSSLSGNIAAKAHTLKAHTLKAHTLKAHTLKAHTLKAHTL